MTETHAYGTWPSPISAAIVAEAGVRLGEIDVDGDAVYWLEARPTEGGRHVVVRRHADGEATDAVPSDANARTRVHEYGGGSFAVHGGTVWFVEFRDQQIHRIGDGGEAEVVTNQSTSRFADLVVSPEGRWIICVRETHPGGGASEVVNDLVAVPSDGSGDPVALASGRDFYAAPRLSPNGTQLAWLEWDHPNMPWDGTELLLASFENGRLGSVAGHHGGKDESLFQPEWSPDGVLHVISDRSGWWNIHRLEAAGLEPVHELEAEVGTPAWLFGFRRYTFLADGRIVFAAFEHGRDRLGVLDGGSTRWLDVPHRSMGYLRALGDRVLYVGSSPTAPSAVLELDPDAGTTRVLRRSAQRPVDEAFLAEPEHIMFPTAGGEFAHALLYRPTNPDFRGPDDERPPLLVHSHGGPTSHAIPAFLLDIQYWTSRGFAVVDVNYRGSTGYGREFRRKLDGTWGIVDLEDCTAAATWLAEKGEVDAGRLLISGGSAGGYTTLCALTFRDVFAAGASHFGVADIEALVKETHKFESRYIDRLVGPWPDAAEAYEQRSPIHHTDRLATPMIVLQGLQDEVVPPSQAEAMVAALDEKRVPHAYVTFPDEQHGFRRAENQIRALESELAFYGAVLGFEPADDLPDLEIHHL